MAVREGLLALLTEGPSHGYQLKTAFEAATGGAWTLNVGQVYTTLDRLQRDGLVTSDEADGQKRYDDHRRGSRGARRLVVHVARRHAAAPRRARAQGAVRDRGGRRARAPGHHAAAHRAHPAPPGAPAGDAVARRGPPRQRPGRRRPGRARRGGPALARHLRGAHRDAPAPPPPCPPRTETPMADTTSPASTSTPMAALELRAVVKRYGAGLTEVRALTDVSLRIEPGELVAIMGPSGCGKSTMLHLAGALEDPDAGHVLVGGRDLSTLSATQQAALRRTDVGFVFQRLNLVPSLTAMENVMLPLELEGCRAARGAGAGARCARVRGHRRAARPLPRRLLRRAAAAHRRGPGRRRHPQADPGRRAHRRPRHDDRRRGHRADGRRSRPRPAPPWCW